MGSNSVLKLALKCYQGDDDNNSFTTNYEKFCAIFSCADIKKTKSHHFQKYF